MHDHAPDTRPATLHARIRAEVEARILSGEWKPGDRLPTETELMARYGCSRMTVNKAMASLAATGLISRNRRAGTVVARPRMHAGVLTRRHRQNRPRRSKSSSTAPILKSNGPTCCVSKQ